MLIRWPALQPLMSESVLAGPALGRAGSGAALRRPTGTRSPYTARLLAEVARPTAYPQVVGERHLATVLAEYTSHYNDHRPHRSLGQRPPNPPPPVVDLAAARIKRRPILGGLINEYSQAA